MLLPYRAKNPPDRFPIATLCLIALNTLLFLLTSHSGLVIREGVIQDFAVSHATLNPLRLTFSLFLHGHLLHLAGNMLALWVFGGPVEGRLGPSKFLMLYFLSGYTGALLEDFISGLAAPDRFGLGASGAVMGVTGAYLYIFPHSSIRSLLFLLIVFFRIELQARWLALTYVAFDLLNALMLSSREGKSDGVAHFAHLGGFGAGLLAACLMRPRRDSAAISEIQAIRADVKDYSRLTLPDLATLIEQPNPAPAAVLAYSEKALVSYGTGRPDLALAALKRHGPQLLAQEAMSRADLDRLANSVLQVPTTLGGFAPVFYLRLASRLERVDSNDLAAQLYRRIYDLAPDDPDTEVALYRLASLMQHTFANLSSAQATYAEQLRRFPDGRLAAEAQRAVRWLERARSR